MSMTVLRALHLVETIQDKGDSCNGCDQRNLGADETIKSDLTGSARDFAEFFPIRCYSHFSLVHYLKRLFDPAAQFESFIDPFVIMLTVPLALAGAIFSLCF